MGAWARSEATDEASLRRTAAEGVFDSPLMTEIETRGGRGRSDDANKVNSTADTAKNDVGGDRDYVTCPCLRRSGFRFRQMQRLLIQLWLLENCTAAQAPAGKDCR